MYYLLPAHTDAAWPQSGMAHRAGITHCGTFPPRCASRTARANTVALSRVVSPGTRSPLAPSGSTSGAPR
jgi:hypothetical protein